MTYSYDIQSRVLSRTAPPGGNVRTFNYYTPGDRATQVCAAGQCARFFYGPDMTLRNQVFGDGTTNSWFVRDSVNGVHQVVRDTFFGGYAGIDAAVAHLNGEFARRWGQDTLGSRTSEIPRDSTYGGRFFRYDAAGQLINACNDHTQVTQTGVFPSCLDEYGEETLLINGIKNAYTYDSTGNRVDSAAQALVGAGNRLTRFKGYTLAYDLNGNVISKKGSGGSWGADTTLFTWNANGELIRTEKWLPGGAHTIVNYRYDAFGRRVSRTINGVAEWYVYDGDQVVLDVDSATHAVKAEYGYGQGVDNLVYVRTPSWTGAVLNDLRTGTIQGVIGAQ